MALKLLPYLFDVLEACDALEDVLTGVALEDYREKCSIRSSVEREFVIMGEASRRISVLDSFLFMHISNSRSIVDFRNLLTHNYGAVNDAAVYGLVYSVTFRNDDALAAHQKALAKVADRGTFLLVED